MVGAGSKRLEFELTARDMTGKAFGTATARMKNYTSSTKREFKDMMGAATSYGKLVGSILTAKVLSRGFAYLEQEIYNVTTNIVDMDQALTAASAKFGETAYKGTQGWSEMSALTRDIAGTTEFTASETASALDFLGMAGFNQAQAMKSLRPLTDLATASQMDFARASDIASDAMGAFNLSMAPDKIERNLNRVNDVFAKTVTTSNTTMETLFDTMKLAGPVVGNVEMFGALAGSLGSAGIKGTIAATTMKNMFVRLQAPPAEAAKALRKLKLDVDDGTGSLKDMITIIGEMNTALAGKNEIQRNKFLKDIFGMRAIAGVNVLLRTGEERLRAYHEELSNSEGAASEMAETMRSGLGTQLKVLQSTLMAKGFDIFEGLMGKTDPVEALKDLIDVIRGYDVGPIVAGLKEIGSMAKTAAEFLWDNRHALMGLANMWMGMSLLSKFNSLAGGVKGLASAFGMFGGGAGLTGSVMTATTNMGKLTASVGLARAGVMAFNPVVASLIAGLSAGYAMWQAWDAKRKAREERESGLILKYRGAKKLTRSEAEEEARSIQKGFTSRRMSAGDRAKYQNVMEGRISERDLKKIYGGEDLLKMEYFMALQRRLGYETEGKGWRNIYGKSGAAYMREQEDRMKGGASDLNEFERAKMMEEWVHWEGQGQSVFTPGTMGKGAVPRIEWAPKQSFEVNVNIDGAPEGTTATATIQETTPMTDKALGAANG